MKIEKVLINPNSTIRDAINQLNETALQILVVCNQQNQIIGIIMDGDIRRAIIKGVSLDEKVKNIMNKNPKFLKIGFTEEMAKQTFLKYGVKRIPIVDDDMRVVDVLKIEDFIEIKKKIKSNYVVIMAGGRGKRLDPITKIIPKPLLLVGEKTMVEHIIKRFADWGFTKFILTLHYKKEMIKAYIDSLKLPYEIHYVEEDYPMGTAGGLKLVFNRFNIEDTMIVTNCDILVDVNFESVMEFHKEKQAAVTIIGAIINTSIPYGVLKVNDGILEKLEEKPSIDMIINTGIYVIEPLKVKSIFEGEEYLDMTDFLEKLRSSGKIVAVYPHHGEFLDIGQKKLYRNLLGI